MVVAVAEIGGKTGAAVCTEGVADWKSSNSSSSNEFEAAGAATGAEVGIGSSKEKRSASGSFFFGGSGFLGGVSVVFLKSVSTART